MKDVSIVLAFVSVACAQLFPTVTVTVTSYTASPTYSPRGPSDAAWGLPGAQPSASSAQQQGNAWDKNSGEQQTPNAWKGSPASPASSLRGGLNTPDYWSIGPLSSTFASQSTPAPWDKPPSGASTGAWGTFSSSLAPNPPRGASSPAKGAEQGSAKGISASQGGPAARVEGGTVVGSTINFGAPALKVHQFLGIPYARPPQRWSPPDTRVTGWAGRQDATKIKPACIQQFNAGPGREFITSVFNNPPPVESEDCLYLNVYAPEGEPKEKGGRTVMFWLHGGSLQFGTAGQPGYNGSYLASNQDVVVVTVNYRTNVFGFPSSPELPLKERNIGFMDQRAALEWVKNYIAEFGGDPHKVTIFGESAGAASVDALVTSYKKTPPLLPPPLALAQLAQAPPFRAAILQSGNIGIRRAAASPSGQGDWEKLAYEAKCFVPGKDVISCLRKVPVQMIKAIMEVNKLSFGPITDNVTLVSTPEQKRRKGQLHSFPILIGSNAQEGRVFQRGQNNLTAFLQQTFPENVQLQQRVRDSYPPGKDGLNSDYDIASQIQTDLQFGCPSALMGYNSIQGGYPTWRYYFNATFPNLQKFEGAGVYHASEIEMVFGTHGTLPTEVSARPSTPEEKWLSDYIQGAWAKFAKNPTGGPGWASYSPAEQSLSVLGSSITLVSPATVDFRCELYSGLYAV